MPFVKKSDVRQSFTGLKKLKSYYYSICENINSTPAQQLKSAAWLSYLCAETEETRQLSLLNLYATCRRELGYKIPLASLDQEQQAVDPVDQKIEEMFSKLQEGK